MKKIILLFVIAFSFFQCVEEDAIIKKEATFFNLKGYFKSQQATLLAQNGFKKKTTIDGQEIERSLDSLDFSQELKVFEASDINKIAWMDKYQVDSTFDPSGTLRELNYKAEDEKLRTQRLRVSFNQNQTVDTIEVFNNSTGNIATLKQRLRYIPTYGYLIESTQKTALSEEHVVAVEVQFTE